MKRMSAAFKAKSKNDEKDHKAKIYELSTDMKGGIERLQQKHMKSLLKSADFMFATIVLADSKAGTDWDKEENLKLMGWTWTSEVLIKARNQPEPHPGLRAKATCLK